jgi:hypothetical protein
MRVPTRRPQPCEDKNLFLWNPKNKQEGGLTHFGIRISDNFT